MIKKFFLLLLFTATISAQQPPHNQPRNSPQQNQRSQDGAPIINNNNYITVNLPSITTNAINSPESNIENKSNTGSSAQATTHVESSNVSMSSSHADARSMAVAVSVNIGNQEPWHKSITEFFTRNKRRFLIGGISGIYCTIFYHVVQGNYYLKNCLRWSMWHKNIPLKQLRKAPYYKLTAELLCTAQKRYLSITNPTDFSAPLSTFMQELEQEEKQLHFYQKLYRWCSRLWIRRLFPFNIKLYKKISIRLRRIRFLRRRFVKWVTEYKMEQNKTFERAVKLLHTRSTTI